MRVSHNIAREFVSVKKRTSLQSIRKSREGTEALGVFQTVMEEPDEVTMFDLTMFYQATRKELREILQEIVEEKQ